MDVRGPLLGAAVTRLGIVGLGAAAVYVPLFDTAATEPQGGLVDA